MPRVLEIKNSFVTGEISPLVLGRTDLQKYPHACESIINFIVRNEGGISRRPGMRFINALPALTTAKLIPFVFDSENAYVLAIIPSGHDASLMYFYTNDGPVLNGSNNPYAIETPWKDVDDFEKLKWAQVEDVMYIVHPKYPPMKLNRLAPNSWVLTQPTFYAAPATQLDQDVSNGYKLQSSGLQSGSISIINMGPIAPGPPTQATISVSNLGIFQASYIGLHVQEIGGPGDATITNFFGPSAVISGVRYWNYATVTINVPFLGTSYTNSISPPISKWQIVGGTPASPPGTLTVTPSVPGQPLGDIGIQFSAPVLIKGDIGKQIVAGTGIAVIMSLGGATDQDADTGATTYDTANVDIIDAFIDPTTGDPQTAYAANEWFLRGSPGAYFAVGTADAITAPPDPRTFEWHGSTQFGLGSMVSVRTMDTHPTDFSFQQSTGSVYVHVKTTATFVDVFRTIDIGRYVSFSGGYGLIRSLDPFPNGATSAHMSILSAPKDTEGDAQGNLLIAPGFPGAWFFDDVAFIAANGFPGAVCFFQQRLWFASIDNFRPQSVWGSVIDDFENFAKGTLDDAGIEVSIASGNFVDDVLWMQPYLGNIVVGTFRGEYILGGGQNTVSLGQNSVPITPTNVSVTFQSSYGATPIQPVIVQENLFFVQRSQLNVYSMEFNIQSAIYSSKDMTVLNELIADAPIIEMIYQQAATKIVWFVVSSTDMSNGYAVGKSLIGLTYDKGEGIFAWHRHETDGDILSITVIPNKVNGAIVDELWCVVQRMVNGNPQMNVELMDQDLFVDMGIRQTFNSPVTHVDNLDSLIGQDVVVTADGALQPPTTLASGTYTFPPGVTASDVQVGLNYNSKVITVRPETRAGTSQGIIKRWNKIWLRLYKSIGLVVNNQPLNTDQFKFKNNLEDVEDYTGDVDIINLGYDRAGRVTIEQPNPLPAEVLAMFGQILIGEI